MSTLPPIYSRNTPVQPVNWLGRVIALLVAASFVGVLVTAALILPSHRGWGTHTQLGLQPCGMLSGIGIPCAGCGMTTSFAWMVRGNLLASFYIQPFGCILAILSAAGFWIGLYITVTARPAHRLLLLIPMKYHLMFWIPLSMSAWMWKILIYTSGHDGW